MFKLNGGHNSVLMVHIFIRNKISDIGYEIIINPLGINQEKHKNIKNLIVNVIPI